MKRKIAFLLPFFLLLAACTPPSGLTNILLAVQVTIEAAMPAVSHYAGPQAGQVMAYVNAALGAVQVSANVMGRGPVTQTGADEIAAAWSSAVLDTASLNGVPPDVANLLTAISNISRIFVHQFTAGRNVVTAAARAPMTITVTFSRSDRRALADISQRAAKLQAARR